MGQKHPSTPDGRYFAVRGRLWRLADPRLDPAEREQLVKALMAARRAVRDAPDAEAKARARAAVDAAKRGLGERGPVWWNDGAPDLNRRLARNTPYAEWFAATEEQVPHEAGTPGATGHLPGTSIQEPIIMAKKPQSEAQPQYKVEYREIQPYGTLKQLPMALEDNARKQSIEILNQVLADTMVLRDMYKKHHWQMSGVTFYQLHLLLDEHYKVQSGLVDLIAERIMALGGISVAMPHDVAELTRIPRPPKGREDVPSQLARLLEAHEIILRQSHEGAEAADESGDDGTNDLLVSDIIRSNEPQVWFIAEHLAETEIVRADR